MVCSLVMSQLCGTGNNEASHIEAETKWPPFRRRYFQTHFLNENVRISIKISLKFVPKGPINNIPALVQIMAWRRSGDKPLSEPMMVSLLTHICVTRPQWVNEVAQYSIHARYHISSWINILLVLSALQLLSRMWFMLNGDGYGQHIWQLWLR